MGPRAVIALVVVIPSTTHAEPAARAEPEPAVASEESRETGPAERRCGFAAGLAVGGMIGAASGYPNDARKIDRPAFETDTGTAGGGAGAGWIGLALADWLVFGIGGTGGVLVGGDDLRAEFASLAFHADLFPAYALGGPFRDLGVMLDAGLGLLAVPSPKDDSKKLVDAGAASRLGLGVFYEGLRVWQLSMGPFVAADLMWSPSAMRPTAFAGFRTAIYGGP